MVAEAMEPRLGDILEDHCSRCTRLTDHSIVAIVGGEAVKVRCRTCNHEHAYKHGRSPKRKTPLNKQSAFNQVLAGILASQPPPAAPVSPAARKARKKGQP